MLERTFPQDLIIYDFKNKKEKKKKERKRFIPFKVLRILASLVCAQKELENTMGQLVGPSFSFDVPLLIKRINY